MASVVMTFFAFACILIQMTSCSKSMADEVKCPPATYPITGLWEGTYQTDQVGHPATYVSFAIYPDGTFIRRSKLSNSDENAYFKGRWQMSGNAFQFRDTTLAYSGGVIVDAATATFSNDGTLSNATWQDVSGQPYTGTFQNLKRIN